MTEPVGDVVVVDGRGDVWTRCADGDGWDCARRRDYNARWQVVVSSGEVRVYRPEDDRPTTDRFGDEIVIDADGVRVGGRPVPGVIESSPHAHAHTSDGRVWRVDLTLMSLMRPRYVLPEVDKWGIPVDEWGAS